MPPTQTNLSSSEIALLSLCRQQPMTKTTVMSILLTRKILRTSASVYRLIKTAVDKQLIYSDEFINLTVKGNISLDNYIL